MPSKGRGQLEITELDPITMTPKTRRYDTITCRHCGCVGILDYPQFISQVATCRKCDAYVCDKPGCRSDCNPILESVDLAIKYRETGQPFLLRDNLGYPLHDLSLRDKERPH